MSNAIRLERMTKRTYRIRTSRFAKPEASGIDERREAPREQRGAWCAHGAWQGPSRFAMGHQRRRGRRRREVTRAERRPGRPPSEIRRAHGGSPSRRATLSRAWLSIRSFHSPRRRGATEGSQGRNGRRFCFDACRSTNTRCLGLHHTYSASPRRFFRNGSAALVRGRRVILIATDETSGEMEEAR